MKITLKIRVTSTKSEVRQYRDKETGRMEQYTSARIAGITDDYTTPCLFRCPEQLAPVLADIKEGEVVELNLSELRLRDGLAEGRVLEVYREQA